MASTISGQSLVEATIHQPLSGAWECSARGNGTPLSGAITLVVEGTPWQAAVKDASQDGGSVRYTLIGGRANGWRAPVAAKAYRSIKVRTLLDDLSRESGEVLSDTIATELLEQPMRAYHRQAGRVWGALDDLADCLGVTWRVLSDGTLWLGTDTWAASTAVGTVQTDTGDTCTVQVKAPELRPGMTWQGRRIEACEHWLESNALRTVIWASDPARLMRAAGERNARTRYARFYGANVVSQDPEDGSLELLVDHPELRGNGMGGVPLWTGVDGLSVDLEEGDRVLVGFLDGSPAKPFAMLSPWGGTAKNITLRSSGKVKVIAPVVEVDSASVLLGEGTPTEKAVLGDTLVQLLGAHTHPTGMGPSGPPAGSFSSALAANVKVK